MHTFLSYLLFLDRKSIWKNIELIRLLSSDFAGVCIRCHGRICFCSICKTKTRIKNILKTFFIVYNTKQVELCVSQEEIIFKCCRSKRTSHSSPCCPPALIYPHPEVQIRGNFDWMHCQQDGIQSTI